jgi:hypothetical protein
LHATINATGSVTASERVIKKLILVFIFIQSVKPTIPVRGVSHDSH